MRKLICFLMCLAFATPTCFAAKITSDRLDQRQWESYVDTGCSYSIQLTLSGTPNTITSVTLPDSAKGFKLYSRTNDSRFAVDQELVATVASSETTIAASALGVGGVAKSNQWEVRLLPSYPGTHASRVLSLLSASASTVVELEVF